MAHPALTARQKYEFDRQLRARDTNRGQLSESLWAQFPERFRRIESVRGIVNNWARGDKTLPSEFALEIERILGASLEMLVNGAAPEVVESSVVQNEASSEQYFVEGRQRLILHKAKERNAKAVKRKKEAVLAANGKLACEACSFDFLAFYGELGHGFAECHHRTPLAELHEEHRTTLEDLSIVCANCHRILHRSARAIQMLSVEELRELVRRQRSAGTQAE